MEREPPTEDVLFLACTRPAMWHGVPLEALALNGMATSIVFVAMSNPCYLFAGVAVHYATRALVGHDCNLFQVLRLWAQTKGRARNRQYWGGSSVSPLPPRPVRRPHEVRVHA